MSGATGILFVIAAPSGAGKSTVARRVLESVPGLEFSVSYTTRAPRPEEQDGRHYHFVDRERFERLRREGAFLESATVHGNLYGTELEATRRVLAQGRDLLLDIDLQGARQVRAGPIDAVSIMILPPDFATLSSRLSERGSEDEGERVRRLARSRGEVEGFAEFSYLVVNQDLDAAVEQVRAILIAERRRTARCAEEARRILATFPT
jgi:guanylate kinase